MHLELLSPPALIGVTTGDGGVRPALLLATRGERRYVQISHGPGANFLRWVDAAQVLSAAEPHEVTPAAPAGERGLPWICARSIR